MLVDINCDMGEGMPSDAIIMPFISSANIACGFHAGDEKTMVKTIELALEHGVAIGAHPSFPDRENFGRVEMDLPDEELYAMIQQQLSSITHIAKRMGASLHHVKPHGSLYNMSARDSRVARSVAKAVNDFDPALTLFGLAGSYSITEAQLIGLKTASEAFADRGYEADGSLVPRAKPGASIEDVEKVLEQSLEIIKTRYVTSLDGKKVPILADTICIHGDGKSAPVFAKRIWESLKEMGIDVKAF